MKAVRLLALLCCIGVLAACRLPGFQPELTATAPGAAETPDAEGAQTESVLLPFTGKDGPVEATGTAPSAQDGTATPVPAEALETLSAELRTRLLLELPPTATPNADGSGFFQGFEDVQVFALPERTGDGPLWVAYSVGWMSFDPPAPHFVAVYRHASSGWQEVSRLTIEAGEMIQPGMVAPVALQSGSGPLVWISAAGFAGAHSGCLNLMSFDGQELQTALSHCGSSPLGGELLDLDGDGDPEVLLDRSDYYVFCYACAVRHVDYSVWRWEAGKLVETHLTHISRPAPSELIELNDRAVDLAQGGLWMQAQEKIRQALALEPQNQDVIWNAALINLHADRLSADLQESGFPVLTQVFYGDYDAALAVLRAHSPEEIFSPSSPLIANTVAEGLESTLQDWIKRATDQAMLVNYPLAPAHFLRSWAAYVHDPDDPQVLREMEAAAALDPDEPFYQECLEFLKTDTR